MEFLTSADRRHLHGRENKVRELVDRIDLNQITLLLGNSGSGKTSLIHAGLLPRAIGGNWFPVYTRPLGLPRSDVVTTLLNSVFEGPHSYRGALLAPVEQAASAIAPKRLLLIIDQFEDVLTAREQEEVERLVADLRIIHHLSDARIRVLVSYRADLEARLGRFWQAISGSPEGLARVYIAGVSADDAWQSIESTCEDLEIKLELTPSEQRQIKNDLCSFSATHGEEGIYPPYIQMFIDHAWRSAGNKPGVYRLEHYLASGGMEGVTAGYLKRQLTYADDTEGHLKSALVSLVRSYGVKAQKSLADVVADTGLTDNECEVALEQLIDLRVVRHVGNLYEVAHDFLAREISAKLVDSEEREFKRLRELLASKAATFAATRSFLTVEERLMLFKYKERIIPSDIELSLILASWAREGGPGLHWLLGIPSSRLIELIRAEEGEKRLEDEDRAMLALLRRKASGSPFSTKDWLLFRRYRLAMELAGMLSAAPVECPDAVILWALRSRRKILRDAALEAVAEKITSGKRKWIARLSKSSSPHYRGAYELLVIRDALPLFPDSSALKAPRPYREFGILQRIARSQTRPELRALLRTLKKFRPTARSWLFAQGIAAHRTRGWASILRRLPRLGSSKIETLANSAGSQDFAALLEGYLEWNKKEAQHSGTRLGAIYEEKASALALAVLRTATKRDLALLRDCFQAVALTTSTQYFALTLIRLGDVREVLNIINAIERANHVVRYWFQIEMGHAIERRMTQLGDRLPKSLLRISSRRGFWEDSRSGESRFLRKDLLALEHPDNRALYLRVVAHAIIGLAGREDLDVVQKLTQHSYRMIARAAAIRLIRVAGDAGIKMLQAAVVASIERGNSEAFGLAVRDAEIQSFGLAELC